MNNVTDERMLTRRRVLEAFFAASASMLAGSVLAANEHEPMRYWDNHAGVGYAGPQDVDLLNH